MRALPRPTQPLAAEPLTLFESVTADVQSTLTQPSPPNPPDEHTAGLSVVPRGTSASSAPAWAQHGLGARWWDFHVEHPEVADALVQLARPLVKQGHSKLGIAMLWETLRYTSLLGTRDDEPGPRLNNNHRAYYARWLDETCAELHGFFEVRELRAS